MKRSLYLSIFTLAAMASLMLAGCQSPEQKYVKKAVKLMDKHGLFAEGPAWKQTRAAALEARPGTKEEAYEITRTAIKVAGGKHSFISTVERQQESAAEDMATEPSVTTVDDGILLIVLPHFSGQSADENQR